MAAKDGFPAKKTGAKKSRYSTRIVISRVSVVSYHKYVPPGTCRTGLVSFLKNEKKIEH